MTKPEVPDISAMLAEPQQQHHWLEKFVGEWTYEGEAAMEPGQPAMKFSGTESARSIGGLWTVAESKGEMPDGGTATMIITLGYDTLKKRYVGTWVGSMMTYMWVYEGSLDTTGKILTLDSVGPSTAVPGTMTRSQDIIEFVDDNYRVLRSQLLGDDGQWHQVMEAHYRRKS